MCGTDRSTVVLLLALALGAPSCASSPHAPRRWLDPPQEAAVSGYGGWVDITPQRDKQEEIGGELLAVGEDTVYVLTVDRLEAIPKREIKKARIALYRSQGGTAASYTAGGTVASLSHGIGFILTGPFWIVVGSLTASSVSSEPLHDVPDLSWSAAAIYSRFPQGLPPDLDLTTLRPKVAHPDRPIRVTLKDGQVLLVRGVEYSRSMQSFALHLEGGRTEHIGALHVRSIVGPDGTDLMKDLVKP